MGNRDIAAARDYHERTKHSPVSIRSGPHYLDWDHQPHPFKVYENLDSLALEEHLGSSGVPALEAISRSVPEGERQVTGQELGELLFLCAGVTRRRRYFGGEMLFRAAACTGALYHIDVYVVAGPLADLDAGVYHFAPERFALTALRTGDHRGALVEASGGEPAMARAPAVLVFASTFWRNSWKYRDRAYRHCFWDGGTILANCLAAASARDIPARTVMGFADGPVNHLLGLNPDKEAALCLVPVGRGASPTVPSGEALPPLDLVTRPLSRREVDYPSIREMHAASSLESGAEVRSWREREDPNVTPDLIRGPGGAEVRRWPAGGSGCSKGRRCDRHGRKRHRDSGNPPGDRPGGSAPRRQYRAGDRAPRLDPAFLPRSHHLS